jgi:hypothetical protein
MRVRVTACEQAVVRPLIGDCEIAFQVDQKEPIFRMKTRQYLPRLLPLVFLHHCCALAAQPVERLVDVADQANIARHVPTDCQVRLVQKGVDGDSVAGYSGPRVHLPSTDKPGTLNTYGVSQLPLQMTQVMRVP